jgi:UDP-N-acetylglucosamine 2-epimerase
MLKWADLLIGNSSSIVVETPFTGTPGILLGDRQLGRPIAGNIVSLSGSDAEFPEKIRAAIQKQLSANRFAKNDLYGDGNSSGKIMKGIAAFLGVQP